MDLLNIGCGATFHEAWTNIDLTSNDPAVRAVDIRHGLPFPDGSFDAAYSSHVLEHLTPTAAESLLAEAYRVLRPGGIIRIAVPDLQKICELYLDRLHRLLDGDSSAEQEYDWILLELYDQVTRTESGGDMLRYLRRTDLKNKEFIRSRIGSVAEEVWNPPVRSPGLQRTRRTFSARIRGRLGVLAVRVASGREGLEAYRESRFRRRGEIHRCMYDRFSLSRLLTRVGFSKPQVRSGFDSAIPDFASYGLDVVDGELRKPDSLFVEAVRP